MKNTLTAVGAAIALASTSLAWDGGQCNSPQKVTVNRYNYYQPNNGWGNCGRPYPYGGGGGNWGCNGYGQKIPNGLGWTLFGIGAFMNMFAPRAMYVQYPMYQSPAPVIIER